MMKLSFFLLLLILLISCKSSETEKVDSVDILKKDTTTNSDTINPFSEMMNKFLIPEEMIKWRIFEKGFNDTLKIYRNRIYAKHGYKFNSKDSHLYFSKMDWYKINPKYDHSLLTKHDSITINMITKYEQLLNHLSQDSVEILKDIINFRNLLLEQGYDKTVTVKKDITDDSKIESFSTRIKFINNKLQVENILQRNKQEIWTEKYYVDPCLDYIPSNDVILKNYPRFGYYYILLKDYFDTLTPKIEQLDGNKYVKRSISESDTTYELSGLLFNADDTSRYFKSYLYNFKGCEVYFPQAYCLYDLNVGYTVKVWDELQKTFIYLWSGP